MNTPSTIPSAQNSRQDNNPQIYHHNQPFVLENGEVIQELTITYQTWGTLSDTGDNVVWVCHALTANAAASEWWPNLIGEGLAFDTSRYFVVCANILGSCYGTTGPGSTNPQTGQQYGHHFPFITIRDMVAAHVLLRQHLGIRGIHLLAGGSMGGYQVLEWAVMEPAIIQHIFLITTAAKETAWGIGIHTAQRMAIETDPTWQTNDLSAGREGLKVARAIGMVTYRSYESFVKTQTDTDDSKQDGFMASSYIKYQGEKLASRFTAVSYYTLSKAMDTHNLGRGRGSVEAALGSIRAKTLVIGITSDLLCPLQEQQLIAAHIPGATYAAIDSLYGHDGFLVETAAITDHLRNWLTQ
ncbi:homoserine O-acetyltransferase [Flavisolibacter sp. BT320]|nr:homoserine O-acetyltransferase [Flavisolibacter longurius]